jgi:6,7-dimethyl-8-ribityllumazine synthase
MGSGPVRGAPDLGNRNDAGLGMIRSIEGQLNASGMRVAIVAARFNSFVVEHLVSGATDTLVRHGARADDITIVRVPGSFEIPLACKKLAETGRFDGIIALGAVIRGATSHYDLVCSETAKGISSVALEFGLPVSFGVLTTDTIEQAIERSGTKAGNKGCDAAMAVIEMVSLGREIGKVRQ